MGLAPDPTRLRELSREAASIDYTAEAWKDVGRSLEQAIQQESQSRGHSQK
ncbi:hypothetical protein [Sanguibacter sp. Z1732]